MLDGGREAHRVEDALYGVLPLLERDPKEAVAAVAQLGGPPFPFEALLLTALDSDSGYWQERAVPWLYALDVRPTGALADAAQRACDRKLADQHPRQRLAAWLRRRAD